MKDISGRCGSDDFSSGSCWCTQLVITKKNLRQSTVTKNAWNLPFHDRFSSLCWPSKTNFSHIRMCTDTVAYNRPWKKGRHANLLQLALEIRILPNRSSTPLRFNTQTVEKQVCDTVLCHLCAVVSPSGLLCFTYFWARRTNLSFFHKNHMLDTLDFKPSLIQSTLPWQYKNLSLLAYTDQ